MRYQRERPSAAWLRSTGAWGRSPHFVIGPRRRCVASSERYGSLTVSERSSGAFLVWQRGCRGALPAPLRLFGSFSALRKNIYLRDAIAASSRNVRVEVTPGRGARAPYDVQDTPKGRGTGGRPMAAPTERRPRDGIQMGTFVQQGTCGDVRATGFGEVRSGEGGGLGARNPLKFPWQGGTPPSFFNGGRSFSAGCSSFRPGPARRRRAFRPTRPRRCGRRAGCARARCTRT